MISIYIHIPFCVRKCKYCDFLSFPADETTIEAYVEALCRHIELIEMGDRDVTTLFFGGGTPSILSSEQIELIINKIKSKFNILPSAEISLECNPGTATLKKLSEYRKIGINRLSIGLQSANDDELVCLGRIHDFNQFLATFTNAKSAGFENINVDIMSALPGQTLESYKKTLTKVVKLHPEHISAYSLIIEENTPFGDIYCGDSSVSGLAKLPDEDTEREMYYETERVLKEAGYNRYEISNYSLSGYECRHNKVYWTGKDYISFGIGAASYINGTRYNNTSDMGKYLKNPLAKEEISVLSKEDRMEEYMFVGLRLMDGISIAGFSETFGVKMEEVYGKIIDKHIHNGLLQIDNDRLRLTSRGIDVSNTVLADFLL